MTLQEVQDWLDSIRAATRDFEVAHGSEDSLHQAVLQSIADGTAEDPQAMAALALTSNDISFGRHCA